MLFQEHTINGERFAGLNFRVFHGFQEHRESFTVNIHFIIQASYNAWHCFSVVNVRHRESFPVKNYTGWNPRKFSPVNLSPFTVVPSDCYSHSLC